MRIADTFLAAAALLAGLAGTGAGADLVSRGVFTWQEPGEDFGGFSGLVMAPGGAAFHAVSDQGELYHARVTRDGAGRITGIATDWQGRLLDNHGNEVAGFTADAEALAPAKDGGLYVAFESYTRVTRIAPPDLDPVALNGFDRFRDLWSNESFESLAERPGGGLVAVVERADAGVYPTFLGEGSGYATTWRPGPGLPDGGEGFDASDAAFGPDGRFYLLERRLTLGGFAIRIRRFGDDAGGFGAAETLLQTPAGTLGNMEGISLWTDPDGRTIVSLISDDNFLFVQKTILAEYELREAQ